MCNFSVALIRPSLFITVAIHKHNVVRHIGLYLIPHDLNQPWDEASHSRLWIIVVYRAVCVYKKYCIVCTTNKNENSFPPPVGFELSTEDGWWDSYFSFFMFVVVFVKAKAKIDELRQSEKWELSGYDPISTANIELCNMIQHGFQFSSTCFSFFLSEKNIQINFKWLNGSSSTRLTCSRVSFLSSLLSSSSSAPSCCCVCTLRLRDMLDWVARARLVVRGNIANFQFSLFRRSTHYLSFRTIFLFIQAASRAPDMSGLDFHWFARYVLFLSFTTVRDEKPNNWKLVEFSMSSCVS